MTRRGFLGAAAGTAAVAVGGAYAWHSWGRKPVSRGAPLAMAADGKLLDTDFPDPFAGGEFLSAIPFDLEDSRSARHAAKEKQGHDARRAIDLSSLLTPEGRTTPADRYYIRTEYPDRLQPPADWTIKLHGEVDQPRQLPLKSLQSLIEPRGPVLMECSGNSRNAGFGLLSVANWSGIAIEKVIERAHPTAKAKAVLINGFDDDSRPSFRNHSKPTCSWIFPIDQLVSAKAFLATEMNGAPLDKDLGAPLRLIVPGWYGCVESKWVDEIKFVDSEQPATLQMLEFASRTLQPMHTDSDGQSVGPERAREYLPAVIDQAAIPVRVEAWRLKGKLAFRIVGITWGGGRDRTGRVMIRFLHKEYSSDARPVTFCANATSNPEYGIWVHQWRPTTTGFYWIRMRVDGVPSRKMHVVEHSAAGTLHYYDRCIYLPQV